MNLSERPERLASLHFCRLFRGKDYDMTKAVFLTMLTMCTLVVPAQEKGTRVEQDIRRVNADEVAALVRNDAKVLESIWSDDFVVTNPLNKFVNKEEVLTLIKSGVLAFSSYERRIEYVRIYQDVVVVAGSETVTWAGRMPNAGKTSLLRFTGVWREENGRWHEVARHANVVANE